MFYRTVAIFIVLFWLTMTALLVHQELRPGESALREIPVSHVVKMIFMHHHDPQRLLITSDKRRIGQLTLAPKIDPQTQDREVEFNGFFQITVPGAKPERVGMEGLLDMDKLLNIQRFQLRITTHTPAEMITALDVLPQENLARYEVRAEGVAVDRQDFTLDESGARAALEHAGIDPSIVPISWKQPSAGTFSTKARLSSLAVHGGQLDTFLVTVESNGQTLLECHIDQLGRVVRATTLLGYTLAPEDITP
jgi:hypothetical protein